MELAPGAQAAAGVGEVEHSLLIAGEEDEQVFDPLEAGVILVVKTEVELPAALRRVSGMQELVRHLVQRGHPVAHELGCFFIPDGDAAVDQDGQVDL